MGKAFVKYPKARLIQRGKILKAQKEFQNRWASKKYDWKGRQQYPFFSHGGIPMSLEEPG
jgi:hypothetical protein